MFSGAEKNNGMFQRETGPAITKCYTPLDKVDNIGSTWNKNWAERSKCVELARRQKIGSNVWKLKNGSHVIGYHHYLDHSSEG